MTKHTKHHFMLIVVILILVFFQAIDGLIFGTIPQQNTPFHDRFDIHGFMYIAHALLLYLLGYLMGVHATAKNKGFDKAFNALAFCLLFTASNLISLSFIMPIPSGVLRVFGHTTSVIILRITAGYFFSLVLNSSAKNHKAE